MSSLFTLDLAIEYCQTIHHPYCLRARRRAPYDHSIYFLTFGRCRILSMTLRGLSPAIPYPSLYFSLLICRDELIWTSMLRIRRILGHIMSSVHMDIPHLALSKARQPWHVSPSVVFVCFYSRPTVRRRTEPIVPSIVFQFCSLFTLLVPSTDRFAIRQHRLLVIAHRHCRTTTIPIAIIIILPSLCSLLVKCGQM